MSHCVYGYLEAVVCHTVYGYLEAVVCHTVAMVTLRPWCVTLCLWLP